MAERSVSLVESTDLDSDALLENQEEDKKQQFNGTGGSSV